MLSLPKDTTCGQIRKIVEEFIEPYVIRNPPAPPEYDNHKDIAMSNVGTASEASPAITSDNENENQNSEDMRTSNTQNKDIENENENENENHAKENENDENLYNIVLLDLHSKVPTEYSVSDTTAYLSDDDDEKFDFTKYSGVGLVFPSVRIFCKITI